MEFDVYDVGSRCSQYVDLLLGSRVLLVTMP